MLTSEERINMNLPIRETVDGFKWPLGTLACLLMADMVWNLTHVRLLSQTPITMKRKRRVKCWRLKNYHLCVSNNNKLINLLIKKTRLLANNGNDENVTRTYVFLKWQPLCSTKKVRIYNTPLTVIKYSILTLVAPICVPFFIIFIEVKAVFEHF